MILSNGAINGDYADGIVKFAENDLTNKEYQKAN